MVKFSMIELTDRYILNADTFQFKLQTRLDSGLIKTKGYYPSLSTLIRGLSERKLYELAKETQSIKAIQDEFITWSDQLKIKLTDIRDKPVFDG